LQFSNLGLHVRQLGFRSALDIPAPRSRTHPKVQELGDLVQGEAQRLRILDEPQPPLRISVVQSVAGWQPRRRAKRIVSMFTPTCFASCPIFKSEAI